MAGGGGCTAGEGAGSGYGSAHAAGSRVHRTPCPAHHQGAQRVAEQGLNNAGRVLAAGTALLAAAVAVAAVTLAGPRTKPGVYVDLARAGVGWSDILPGTARQAGRSARGARRSRRARSSRATPSSTASASPTGRARPRARETRQRHWHVQEHYSWVEALSAALPSITCVHASGAEVSRLLFGALPLLRMH